MPLPLFLGLAAAAAAGAGVIKNQVEKSKTQNAVIEEAEEQCKKEAQAFKPQKTPTEFQQKMFNLLRKHTFTDSDKSASAPISSDWPHLSKGLNPVAAKKHSLIGWGDYSFYTTKAAYYHCKKKGVHECLYFDYINSYDSATCTVDYGPTHQKKCISQWDSNDQAIIANIARVWSMSEEKDTRILEFCFNYNWDFKRDLCYFKTNEIRNMFKSVCSGKGKTIADYHHYIKINSMKDGKIELQFWYYFHRVENVVFSENDTEEDIREKEWEQERRQQEAEDLEREVYWAHEELMEKSETIVEIFQQALYRLYGVLFEKENITFLEEPDYTYEGPSLIDRVEGAANSAKAFVSDYVERNCK